MRQLGVTMEAKKKQDTYFLMNESQMFNGVHSPDKDGSVGKVHDKLNLSFT